MRFVTQKTHALLDYPLGIALTLAPVVFGIGMSNAWAFVISVVAGLAMIVMTLMTDHETGVLRIFSFETHLVFDALVGASFIALPLMLGFTGVEFTYYIAFGFVLLGLVGLHSGNRNALVPAE